MRNDYHILLKNLYLVPLDPPENLTISKSIVNVVVDHIPEKISCAAKAYPEPQFEWYREGSNEILGTSNTLSFEHAFPKRSNGTYYCQVKNRQGVRNISTYINVQCKSLHMNFR